MIAVIEWCWAAIVTSALVSMASVYLYAYALRWWRDRRLERDLRKWNERYEKAHANDD